MDAAARLRQPAGLFSWWREADARAHRAFLAASFGWMLDAFDVMLFSLVLVPLMRDLNLTPAQEARSARSRSWGRRPAV